ncbi:hypothetical protein DICPUDRAFT_74743 [Dictyostelium purpureum]|uniref:Protein FRA10AC1 n=1 Tax=Dictyostelium purpureum TaxID=5786 RepID=F0Z8M7_DICPU|nr:uncharacterized protein DICPUDRAFT_74743 [Dictyostelium purpureum]EGC39684.1 hypothetical protein DICPUDRAFT_74743 [Dictyostelium purpureum]|eukprot:XP_003283793.1 hypothetical protein DICPUDRAFT_74743 [Dictyostelium purpureum]
MNLEDYEKLKKLDAFSRHKKFINDYFSQKNKEKNKHKHNSNNNIYRNYKSDYDILKENHQFLRDQDNDTDDSGVEELTWEERLAKKYYDRLYKEYAIIDLSHYKSGEIGLRWRIESEVVSGRGQFTCANKKCSALTTTRKEELKSFEVPFSYREQNQDKIALVKVVLCPLCSKLLNYSNIKKKKKELKEFLKKNDNNKKEKEKEKEKDKDKKKRKNRNDNGSDSDNYSSSEDIYDRDDYEESKENASESSSKKLKIEKEIKSEDNEDIFKDMFI